MIHCVERCRGCLNFISFAVGQKPLSLVDGSGVGKGRKGPVDICHFCTTLKQLHARVVSTEIVRTKDFICSLANHVHMIVALLLFNVFT
jgi:hypothetical protein